MSKIKKFKYLSTSMLFCLIASILCSSICFASKNSVSISVGYTDFHPLAYTENGAHRGVLLDIMRTAAKEANYKVSFYPLRANQIATHIENRNLDLWLGLRNHPAIKKGMVCGELDVYALQLKAYTVKSRPIKDINDLKGKKLILLRGYGYGGNVTFFKDKKNRIKHREASSHASAFKMLKRNPSAYVIDYHMPSLFALKKIKIPRLKSYDIDTFYVRFCVSKKLKNAEQIVEDLEGVISRSR